jgi:hypothetical protein
MYAEQWEDYRKRRLIFLSVWLGWVPVGLTVVVLLSQVFTKEIVDRAFFAFFGIWGLVFWWTGYRLIYWRCPRCDNYYFVGLIRASGQNYLSGGRKPPERSGTQGA